MKKEAVLLMFFVISFLVAATGCQQDRATASDDEVVMMADGTEVPAREYEATHVISDPTVTDERNSSGVGAWFKTEPENVGNIVKLWRPAENDPATILNDPKYIWVTFESGHTAKCSVLDSIEVDAQPWAKFTKTKYFDGCGSTPRQDYMDFDLKVPQWALKQAKSICAGKTGEILF